MSSQAKSLAFQSRLLFPDTFAEYASDGQWSPYPFIQQVARQIFDEIRSGTRSRMIFCWPPQHGKSEFFSHWLPTWHFCMFPERDVLITSYADDFVKSKWGRAVRNELKSNPRVPVGLSDDKTAASEFVTEKGGALKAAGTDGQILGRGGDLVIVDDPIKNYAEAQNPRAREDVEEWWEGTMTHRLQPGSTVVVITQRWHHDDFPNYLMNQSSEEWECFSFPAIMPESRPDETFLGEFPNPLDERDPGEALCPDLKPAEFLDKQKAGMRDVVFDTVYQQMPPGEATTDILFPKNRIEEHRLYCPDCGKVLDYINRCPACEWTRDDEVEITHAALGIDPAGEDSPSSDETGLIEAATDGEAAYILKDESDRYSPQDWASRATTLYYGQSLNAVVAEVNFGGDMVRSTIHQMDPNVKVVKQRASKGKAIRAEPVAALLENDKLFFVGEFPELEQQMYEFRTGQKESPDRMDALVWAVHWLLIDRRSRSVVW